MNLRLDWCSHEAAKYAVEHWHYSGCLPGADSVKVGVWEDGRFIGAVIFSRGATINIASPFGLRQTEVCELTRVALDKHQSPVSRILAIALKLLRKQCPALRVVVSFADTEQGHHGGIYQATGWVYVGTSKQDRYYRVNGIVTHPKSLHSRYGKGGQSIPWLRSHVDPNASTVFKPGKHKYVMALDAAMRQQIEPLRKPYPKRAGSDTSDTPANHAGEGGSSPTPALQ
jgi:hypothetical protein